ncbi:MAG: hypothetical protein MnENMB40S_37280 [Rhizobiaceae bacterium MnEN-MB40S]|nr:MAG: hypothetical protein MnENMB40S_37280 [Rhizobiaceae bacterium MnEN-MB40S]
MRFFNAQLTDAIRIYGLRLFKGPAKRILTYSPQRGKRRAAMFTPKIANEITAAAIAAWETETVNDITDR